MAITSTPTLLDHGQAGLRRHVVEIAEAGLAASDGGQAVHESVRLLEEGVEIDGRLSPLDAKNRLIVLGGGKATRPVARALEEVLGDRIDAGAIVLRRGELAQAGNLEVLHADHPLPSPDSVLAAQRITALADQCRAGDMAITCFTGGRSALLSMPPPGVRFQDKRRLNELLIASGMPISEINTVRKHVSLIKGGRLADRIAPARIVNLTVPDVAGDELDVLADLTTRDGSTPEEAIDILRRRQLFDRVPESVRRNLMSDAAISPALEHVRIETVMLVDGRRVCQSMAAAAEQAGLRPEIVSTTLEGPATEIGERIGGLARSAAPGTALLGCGGEATVNLGGAGFGEGGPNQEAAIAAALEIAGHPVAIAFIDTDGSDGGTEAAGAICDGNTSERAQEADLDLPGALASHRSGELLLALRDQILTGPTGTNVNDLFVAVVG